MSRESSQIPQNVAAFFVQLIYFHSLISALSKFTVFHGILANC